MEKALTTERKEALLRFMAALAWADGVVEQDEIDFIMNQRKKLQLPASLDTQLQKILVTHHGVEEIAREYNNARSMFAGSRNMPNRVVDGVSVHMTAEQIDALFTQSMFEILSSDGRITPDEGQILQTLQNTGNDIAAYKQAKNVVYGHFPGTSAS